MKRESRTVVYRGNVQGVGFRWTARGIAAGYAVTGYVRNLPDGRVELFAEGEAAELDGFLGEVRRTMSMHIREETCQRGPDSGQFSAFQIRY